MAPFFNDYAERKLFAKLGFTDSLEDLDARTADAFVVIENTIGEFQQKEAKKKRRK